MEDEMRGKGGYEKCTKNLVGSLKGRPRRTCNYNIKMDHREVGYDDVDWIHLTQDRD
jgi:hypothetical protein